MILMFQKYVRGLALREIFRVLNTGARAVLAAQQFRR